MTEVDKSNKIIERAMSSLGIDFDLSTDPILILEILEAMKLNDLNTTFAPMKRFFTEATSSPQPLRALLESVKLGLVCKHPAVVEFLEVAEPRGWLEVKNTNDVARSLHIAYILEAMTASMANNHSFFVDVQDHLRNKEFLSGLNTKRPISAFRRILGVTHSFFDSMKVISVEPSMIYFRLLRGLKNERISRRVLKSFYKENKLNYLEYKVLLPTTKNHLEHILELAHINIDEAGITEYEHGFKTNAISAYALSEDVIKNPPMVEFGRGSIVPENSCGYFYKEIISKENLFPSIHFSPAWIDLYISWNAAFVLGNLNELDLLLPKLFIPSVINAKEEYTAGARIIALWLSINSMFFRLCDQKISVVTLGKKKEMAREWGRINKKYAATLVKEELQEDQLVLKKGFRAVFSRPIYHLLKIILTF